MVNANGFLVPVISLLWLPILTSCQNIAEEILADSAGASSRPVVVHIPDLGKIQGKRLTGTDFFGGIPYAAPPVGRLRWSPPEPAKPWSPAKLDASHFGPDCWQISDPLANPAADASQMSEDCLYLNVFTPAGHSARNEKLPVMVWFHGGAFQMGGARRAEYDGRRLAERGTVVVTLNYRLGALGFLVSSSDGVMGNFGLMDQRAALFWVKDYIRHFGGDPDNITMFGESAGAVMAVLHMMMEGAGSLFHKVIIQSNPLGLQFRPVVVANFIGEALKQSIDCRDLTCMRSERVEEIIRAQTSLMGVPRSVGDFFTWGPTLSESFSLTVGIPDPFGVSDREVFRDVKPRRRHAQSESTWASVNVTQPLKHLDMIPGNISVIIGCNRHEGEMFVHGAFPITMSKAVYWMFVGALFRDSASRVLRHYRGHVDKVEAEARELARKQIEEEENRQYYLENQENLERQYQTLLEINTTDASDLEGQGIDELVRMWTRGGASDTTNATSKSWIKRLWRPPRKGNFSSYEEKKKIREERRKARSKERAMRQAARVVVDYRPVMSRIIDDYLFRCPSWHFAHSLSQNRYRQGHANNVHVYQFSHSTHIPGYKECWGKACHMSEIPYVFEAMGVIRSTYSTLGPHAQAEAPTSPQYPYTDILEAYREAVLAADKNSTEEQERTGPSYEGNYTFQRILDHFFGDYFKEDPDGEIANDMANRWVEFAKTGDPNYSDSKAEWKPWRHVFEERPRSRFSMSPKTSDFEELFNLDSISEEDGDKMTHDDEFAWSDAFGDRVLRRRILRELSMETIEEDVFQTLLRKQPRDDADSDYSFNRVLFGASPFQRSDAEKKRTRRARRQLLQLAQEMNLMGTGLQRGLRSGPKSNDDDFFPQILELKWPPEDRLVERDCTCDLWAKIGYRY